MHNYNLNAILTFHLYTIRWINPKQQKITQFCNSKPYTWDGNSIYGSTYFQSYGHARPLAGTASGMASDSVRGHYTSTNEGKEGNVLFNDALNTFYLRLYGVGQIHPVVKL